MQSVIAKNFALVRTSSPLALFRSYRLTTPMRPAARFYLRARLCDVVLWFLDHPEVSGLFNLGTGRSRTWLDLAYALFDAAEQPRKIEFIDMPPV